MDRVQSRRPSIGRLRTGSVVSRVNDPGNGGFTQKYACATCQITYEVPRGKISKCPLCVSRESEQQLRAALQEHRTRLERAINELNRLKPLLDLVVAMRSALEVTGPEDLTFLKSVGYRFRDNDSIRLKVLSGRNKDNRTTPIGFVLDHMQARDPEVHKCTSIGGLALAGYVEQSMRTVGRHTTMQHLLHALNDHLTGGLE